MLCKRDATRHLAVLISHVDILKYRGRSETLSPGQRRLSKIFLYADYAVSQQIYGSCAVFRCLANNDMLWQSIIFPTKWTGTDFNTVPQATEFSEIRTVHFSYRLLLLIAIDCWHVDALQFYQAEEPCENAPGLSLNTVPHIDVLYTNYSIFTHWNKTK